MVVVVMEVCSGGGDGGGGDHGGLTGVPPRQNLHGMRVGGWMGCTSHEVIRE